MLSCPKNFWDILRHIYTLFFYKQHFYKQHEAQNGQKFLANFKQNPEAQFLVLVIKQQEFSLKFLP